MFSDGVRQPCEKVISSQRGCEHRLRTVVLKNDGAAVLGTEPGVPLVQSLRITFVAVRQGQEQ